MSRSYGADRENAARSPGPLNLAPPLKLAWSASTAVHVGWDRRPHVLAHDNRVFVASPDSGTVALDALTGTPVWKYPIPGSVVALDQGRLFMRVGGTEMHVVDAMHGLPESAMLCLNEGPVIVSGPFLVGHTRHPEHDSGCLFAIDWTSGRRLWTEVIGTSAEIVGHLAVNSGALVYFSVDRSRTPPDCAVVARELSTGAERGRRNTDYPSEGFLSMAGDLVIAPLASGLAAFRLSDGKTLWEKSRHPPGLLYGERYYTLPCDARKGWAYTVLDAESGDTVAQRALQAVIPKSRRLPASIVAVTETHVLLGDNNPGALLVALTRDEAEYKWFLVPPNAKNISLGPETAWVDGRLFICESNRVHCLEQT